MVQKARAFGPDHADILIVGEAPGENEVVSGHPFIGASGQELDRMLHEANILRTDCRVTNVCQYRPQDNKIENFFGGKNFKYPNELILEGLMELYAEIQNCNPKLIIALGNTALWALTGNMGITKWRGSQLELPWDAPVNIMGGKGATPVKAIKVVPTIHPAAVLRQWSNRFQAVHDLRRAKRWLDTDARPPQTNFIIRPTFEQAIKTINYLKNQADLHEATDETVPLSVDLETRVGHIECIGIAWNKLDAICIPFMCPNGDYWAPHEEFEIICALRELLEHPRVECIGQNFLYDMQYLIKWWQCWPYCSMDIMIAHATCFPGTDKGLGYLSSMYCEYHVYWKDEGKHFDPKIKNEHVRWTYNCKDAVHTMEIAQVLNTVISKQGLQEQYNFEMSMFDPILQMMVGGVRFNYEEQIKLAGEMGQLATKYESFFTEVIGRTVGVTSKGAKAWYRSPPQTKALFYDQFKCKVYKDRTTKKPSTKEEALKEFAKQKPILEPLTNALTEYRSIGVYKSTFLEAAFDADKRMRCYYNIVGAETFRFSSSKNAFDGGMNLQNIPREDEEQETEHREFEFPNVRALFIPDEGCSILEFDLKQADAQIVAWEANDADLKQKFRDPKVDVHTENAKDIFGSCTGKGDIRRHKAKEGVHLTNYMGSAYVLAHTLGITVHEAEGFQARWFAAHPGIKDWHRRMEESLLTTRSVRNKFGYRRFYFDRIQEILKEAAAWIPQSTVALVIDKGLINVHENLPDVRILMQVHDSLVFQVRTEKVSELVPRIQDQLLIKIPYKDPLVIPVTCKVSSKSWGECEDLKL